MALKKTTFLLRWQKMFLNNYSLPEEQRAAVAMASMTKLLVEKFCLATTLNNTLQSATDEQ